jgi:hypothetical protein
MWERPPSFDYLISSTSISMMPSGRIVMPSAEIRAFWAIAARCLRSSANSLFSSAFQRSGGRCVIAFQKLVMADLTFAMAAASLAFSLSSPDGDGGGLESILLT